MIGQSYLNTSPTLTNESSLPSHEAGTIISMLQIEESKVWGDWEACLKLHSQCSRATIQTQAGAQRVSILLPQQIVGEPVRATDWERRVLPIWPMVKKWVSTTTPTDS